MVPQLALPGGSPTPMKLSVASMKIAVGIPKVVATMTGPSVFGSRCRHIIRARVTQMISQIDKLNL